MSETGRVLKPANENPWYVLMTLYGEQDGEEVDRELHAKNRAAWNAWAGQGMNLAEQQKTATAAEVDLAEMQGWPTLRETIEARYLNAITDRNGWQQKVPTLPSVRKAIELSDLKFGLTLCCNNFVFPELLVVNNSYFDNRTSFTGALFEQGLLSKASVFREYADFSSAKFVNAALFLGGTFGSRVLMDSVNFFKESDFVSVNFESDAFFTNSIFHGLVGFNCAKFDGDAFFGLAEFKENAEFCPTVFKGIAGFRDVTFHKQVGFIEAKFDGEAGFDRSVFLGDADFGKSRFSELSYFTETKFGTQGANVKVSFSDSQFLRSANFREARFHSCYPALAGAMLHDKTLFTAKSEFWPKASSLDPEQAKASCAAIRHNLGKQGLPEEEHFFFRREMGFTLEIERGWRRVPYWFFKVLSDFGESIERPVTALCWLWFVPTLIYAAFSLTGQICDDLEVLLRSAALSVANLFPLFGFQRIWFDPTGFAALSPWLKVLGGLQTVVSLPLLFFFALGLRTRFRMR